MKFLYRVETVDYSPDLEKTLNKSGYEGWELVSVTQPWGPPPRPAVIPPQFTLFYKRAVNVG